MPATSEPRRIFRPSSRRPNYLRSQEHVQWIIVGEGRMRGWVEEEVRRRGLSNVHLLGQRPPERMPRYFAHADVLLATLRA